jgi:putative ABC transport system permease protein
VIAFGLWKRLGGDPAIVGRTLTMDGRQYTVTGVMPAWFQLPIANTGGGDARTEVWLPLNPRADQQTRDYAVYFCYARMKPGVTLAQGDADVKRVAAEIVRENPRGRRDYTAIVVSVLESVVKEIRPALLLLFGGAGALLLITCANVAGLLLARSVSRARETAVRVALGAARWQLALQYFMEGLLIAIAGAGAGIALSMILVRLVLAIASERIPRANTIGTDWTAVGFAIAVAILSSMLFSLAPLWQAARTLPNEALSDGARASAPSRSRRLSRSLVVAEIALAFTLLSVSAVLIAHLNRLLQTPPGFDPQGVLTFSLKTNDAEYPDVARLVAYQQRLLQAVESVPGVESAALVNAIPLSGCCFTVGIFPEGHPEPAQLPPAAIRIASPGYFQTMRIPLLRGSIFDDRSPPEGIVIGDATAKRYWPGRDALGAYARLGRQDGGRFRVVGIVGDTRNRGLAEITEPEVYFPITVVSMNPTRFVVRSSLPASTLLPDIRKVIRNVNSAQPVTETRTVAEVVLGSLTNERLQSFLIAFFAGAALLMAALGVYGVVSYSVRHRTVEIGTRMALGAVGRDVLRLVIGDGLRMAAYGIAIGGVAVASSALLLKSEIFEIRIDDPRPFLLSTAVIAGFTALACFFPAWRATLVSPLAAIRDNVGSVWGSAGRTLARRMSGMLSSAEDGRTIQEGSLMADFVDASRRSESYVQAMLRALGALCDTLQSESALLLEKSSSGYRCIARTPAGRADAGTIPAAGLLVGRLRGFPFPLPLSPEDFDAWERWASAERPEHVAEIERIRAMNVALAVPLLAKNEISGILLLGSPLKRRAYSASEKQALQNCAGQFALMIENARLTERLVEQEKLNRDILLAAEVQKRLFPDNPPASAEVTLAGMSLPARSVGGDYYDFLDLGAQRIGIALADVAGKGVAAALIMSVVQASLRILAAEENMTLGVLAAKMNRYLHRSTGSNAYATFFYAEIDEGARRLRYVNAGHNPPCLLRCATDRSIEELPAGGTVIGLFPQSDYDECAIDFCVRGTYSWHSRMACPRPSVLMRKNSARTA